MYMRILAVPQIVLDNAHKRNKRYVTYDQTRKSINHQRKEDI